MATPDYQGIKVKAGPDVPGLLPVGNLLDLDNIKDKTRGVKKYTPINNDPQVIATGALVEGPKTMTVLYDPSGAGGVSVLESAIDNDTEVIITIELNDSLGVNGTTVQTTCRVSAFKVIGEQEGKLKATCTIEVIGTPTITVAA